ncbi:MAG: hypothetical protein CXT70_04925 [Methanobacteriota archaeon]|nr:MAG: hypothetical protein CXT70_04925 [Euryarchaeota archaeon]
MADAANGFANVGTMQRATIWGYMAMNDMGTPEDDTDDQPDFNATIARDYAVCYGVGGTFLTNGGGDATWYADTTGDSVMLQQGLLIWELLLTIWLQ